MESLPEPRYCANGSQCCHYDALGTAAKLSTYNNTSICEQCRRQERAAAAFKDSGTGSRKSQSSDDYIGRDLGSDAVVQMQKLKRELLITLVRKKGSFYDAVEDMRQRWSVDPTVGVPPSSRNIPLPEDAPERYEVGTYSEQLFHEYFERWRRDVYTVIEKEVPERFYYLNLLEVWEKFTAACVLYDPPIESLLQLADFGGPGPQGIGALDDLPWEQQRKVPVMAAPPVRTLRDPFKEMQTESWFWQRIISKVGDRYLKPLGLDVWDMAKDVIHNDQALMDEYRSRSDQNRPRQYIDVDEFTTEADVRRAFRQISATQQARPPTGRRSRDRLTCVQCALLHDQQGWTYERLAELHGWTDHTLASKYIKDGRLIFNGS